jgi:hypothetical protein
MLHAEMINWKQSRIGLRNMDLEFMTQVKMVEMLFISQLQYFTHRWRLLSTSSKIIVPMWSLLIRKGIDPFIWHASRECFGIWWKKSKLTRSPGF